MRKPKFFCDPASSNARSAFEGLPVDFVDNPRDAEFVWMRKGYREIQHALGPHQAINHFPNERSMVNKGKLVGFLRKHPGSVAAPDSGPEAFHPETYRLYVHAERKAFLSVIDNEPDSLWIIKPVNLSRGIGVKVVHDLTELRAKLTAPGANGKFDVEGSGEKQYIVQRYLKDVLLLDDRKSEMRIYWMVASVEPLQVLMFNEGTVRLATKPFQLGDYDNPLVHVINVYQQKNHPDYDPDRVLKWSFAELQDDLLRRGMIEDTTWIEQQLLPELHRCLTTVARATVEALRQGADRSHHFALFGADFIMDKNLKPWLTEVQKGPGLSFSDPIKKRIIVGMLQEAAGIVSEIQTRKQLGLAASNLRAPTRFAWLIDDSAAPPVDPAQHPRRSFDPASPETCPFGRKAASAAVAPSREALQDRLIGVAGADPSAWAAVMTPAGMAVESTIASCRPGARWATVGDWGAVLDAHGVTHEPVADDLAGQLLADREITHVGLRHGAVDSQRFAEVVSAAASAGKQVVVDARDTFGVWPVPLGGVDILIAGGEAGLEAGAGISFVIARKDLLAASEGQGAGSLSLHRLWTASPGDPFHHPIAHAVRSTLNGALQGWRAEGEAARAARWADTAAVLETGLARMGFRALPGGPPGVVRFAWPSGADRAAFAVGMRAHGWSPGQVGDHLVVACGGRVGPRDAHAWVAAAKVVVSEALALV